MNRTETELLHQWIAENPLDWYTICGQGYDNISKDIFWKIDRKLKESGFPLLRLVLYTSHSYAVEDASFEALQHILTEKPFAYSMQFDA